MRGSRRDVFVSEETVICVERIGEAHLKALVGRHAEDGECDYCRRRGKVTSVGELAGYVDTAFEHHFRRTESEPSGFDYAMSKEFGWEREGEPVAFMIGEAAQVDDKVAEDIRLILEARHTDIERDQRCEEGPFDEEAHYVEKEADDVEYQASWRAFEESLKTESRYFSAVGETVLEDVFRELGAHRSHYGRPVIVNAGPETDMTSLYRARVFQSTKGLDEALKRPRKEVGPPPANLATAGRMNAYGVSVFYGATQEKLAVAEVRPPVGSQVVSGRFDFTRRARLLDMDALRSAYVKGSVFDGTYIGRCEQAKFLQSLSERISRPVMPNDEPLEYLVTQAIADFLASRSEPELDGIIYRSVQGGGSGRNVVLFHKAARVEKTKYPEGTEIEVRSIQWDEDGRELHRWVVVEVPAEKDEEGDSEPASAVSVSRMLERSLKLSRPRDSRQVTLRLDESSVTVHRIESVRYRSSGRGVSWQWVEMNADA